MDYDRDKVDEIILALMYLTTFEHRGEYRTWKGYKFEHLDRLQEKGLIGDPNTRLKSVTFTTLGEHLSARYFRKHFADGVGAGATAQLSSSAGRAP